MYRLTVLVLSFALAVATLAVAVPANAEGDSLVDQLGEPPQASPVVPPEATGEASAAAADEGTISVPLRAERAGEAEASPDAADAVSPAGCVAQIDDAHIAASVANAVKVNARITCRRPVAELALRVNLYKKHFFGLLNSLQASTVTSDAGRASLQNQNTFRRCTNHKSTKWFGAAQAASLEGGVVYTAFVVSPHVRSLNCGT